VFFENLYQKNFMEEVTICFDDVRTPGIEGLARWIKYLKEKNEKKSQKERAGRSGLVSHASSVGMKISAAAE
jgi:hypothetical protein